MDWLSSIWAMYHAPPPPSQHLLWTNTPPGKIYHGAPGDSKVQAWILIPVQPCLHFHVNHIFGFVLFICKCSVATCLLTVKRKCLLFLPLHLVLDLVLLPPDCSCIHRSCPPAGCSSSSPSLWSNPHNPSYQWVSNTILKWFELFLSNKTQTQEKRAG